MNVQRFTGRNNKLALEQVRIVMGPEALILSNKRTADGVEICAMLETGSVISAIDRIPLSYDRRSDREIALIFNMRLKIYYPANAGINSKEYSS